MGSAPLLIQRGFSESLAGRFQTTLMPHWSFSEMRDGFGWSLDQYIYFGAYPGAVPLIERPEEWASYVRHSVTHCATYRTDLGYP